LECSENDLFMLAGNGNHGAFRKIVEKHQSFVYALAFRFLGNAADAEDAVQESFIRVWRHLSEFDSRKKFTTWLYRIVANLCLDQMKSRSRRRKTILIQSENDLANFPDPAGDPDRAFDDREKVRMVHRLIQDMPDKQRMVFVLRDLQDLSVEEVSGILNMPRHSVKSNLYYARKFLRNRIEGHNQAGD
jgi:RNA polymerase sigma-70 factor (ECF subfamily)